MNEAGATAAPDPRARYLRLTLAFSSLPARGSAGGGCLSEDDGSAVWLVMAFLVAWSAGWTGQCLMLGQLGRCTLANGRQMHRCELCIETFLCCIALKGV